MRGYLSLMAGVLFLLGFMPYVGAILFGKAKPNKVTWIIWTATDCIIFMGMWSEGAVNGQIFGATLGASLVLVLVLKFGMPGWNKIDIICLAGAAIGIALWIKSGDPNTAIITSLVVMAIGSVPTFVSAWQKPERENRLTWTIFMMSCVLAVVAIPKMTLADAAQPIVFLLLNSVMIYLLFFRPKKQEPNDDDDNGRGGFGDNDNRTILPRGPSARKKREELVEV